MKYIILLLSSIAILFAIYSGKKLHENATKKTAWQYDYAEINKVNYGLFNLQLWKEKALDIFSKRITEFEISEQAFDDLGGQIETTLYRLYDEFFSSDVLFEEIYNSLTKSGTINPAFLNLIKGNLKTQIEQLDLKSKVPLLMKSLDQEIRNSEPFLKLYLQRELLRLVTDPMEQNFVEKRNVIYSRYGLDNPNETLVLLKEKIETTDKVIGDNIRDTLIGLAIAFLLLVFGHKILLFKEFILGLTAVSIVFLVLGVTLPMIDIDARLNSFTINLLGEDIGFDEQVLYFQSKSILDVTQTLLEGRGWDLKLVGMLIFLFSIVFPFFKLLLSSLYLYWERIKHSKLAQTVIFYLGKWSMADVFTVAMFMAYIGFYGLVTSQLGDIGRNQTGYAVETVNYSKLSPGAFFFTTYCILSVLTSLLINRNEKMESGN